MEYEDFKIETIKASNVANDAYEMKLISREELDGFSKAMHEAREIFLRLDDAINKEV